MEKLYPLRLSHICKTPIWSGSRLISEWAKDSPSDVLGESWELSVREGDVSVVQNGALRGKTLFELIDAYGDALTGGFGCSDFPLLVKLIDAAEDLSVQVHPDDEYAARVENDRGKTEIWYILDADDSARIVFGLRDGITQNELARALRSGDPSGVLNYIPVRAGECYFIPAGLAHAIGRGVLIAEIQQNCDLTYRLYDYGRLGKDGKLRELHVEKGLEVLKIFDKSQIDAIRFSRAGAEKFDGSLADCEYFSLCRVLATAEGSSLPYENSMRHLLCISGEGELLCDGEIYPVSRGASYLIPASCHSLTLRGSAVALVSVGRGK
jgi:mannose-6-phosphate isomerase